MRREHTDREYEAELRELSEQLLLMGAKVEQLLANAIKALVERDSELGRRMIDFDNDIDELEVAIDERCLRILAKRQPVASDLRFIATVLKIVTDLERIGDLAVNICERAIELNAEPLLKPYIDIPKMAEVVQGMIREALDAFVARNALPAQAVLEQDHMVNAYYAQVFRELLTYMMEDTKTIQRAVKIQAVAKYLERAGDHATNLAEMVIFMARGKDVRHPGRLKTKKNKPHGVLFLCVQNTARSQMAEAWARKLFPVGVRIWSAGSQPSDRVDPRAVAVMLEVGIDISGAHPKRISEIPIGDVDTVIALCAEESCPYLPCELSSESWELPDPVSASTSEEKSLGIFREVRDQIRFKLEEFMKSWTEQ
ncbi:MAG: phosphate signaling complex protein PhoU [Deltaproteobacteria bacterium]|nr:phosphate signaling complex protein PhoU [Deltaproteobacteria bacterium]